jgi:hypothetical protein
MDAGRFRPTETTTAAVREAMAKLFAAQQEAGQRLDDLQAQRGEFEQTGNRAQAEVKAGEAAAVQRELREYEAIGEGLDAMFSEAVRIAAGEAAMTRVGEAQDAIAAYNLWFDRSYEKHANELAKGIALEQKALGLIQSLRDYSGASAALPKLSLTFVGREGRSLSALCRLPAAQPGAPIYWG